jgi:hypothetical protein
MIYFLLFFFCVVFVELFIAFKLSESISSVFELSKEGLAAIRSPDMDDDEKEIYFRKRSIELF